MIKDGLVDIDDISVLKEAEKCASKLCCTDCKDPILKCSSEFSLHNLNWAEEK